jgi:hypothetical protein
MRPDKDVLTQLRRTSENARAPDLFPENVRSDQRRCFYGTDRRISFTVCQPADFGLFTLVLAYIRRVEVCATASPTLAHPYRVWIAVDEPAAPERRSIGAQATSHHINAD